MKHQLWSILVAAILFSCNTSNETNQEDSQLSSPAANVKKEKISISIKNKLIGTYMGDLPCADCQGIKTILTLSGGNKGYYREREIGKKDALATVFEGQWTTNADSSLITLSSAEGKKMFFKKTESGFAIMENETKSKDCGTFDCTLKKSQPTTIKAGNIKEIKEKVQSKEQTVKSTGTFQKAGKKAE